MYVFISVWIYEFLYYSVHVNPFLSSFTLTLSLSPLWPGKPLQAGFSVLLMCPLVLLALTCFLVWKDGPDGSCPVCAPALESTISAQPWFFFVEHCVRNWYWGLCSQALWVDRASEYVYIHIYLHIHEYIYICFYTCFSLSKHVVKTTSSHEYFSF